jgi:predicted amidohydrolase
MNREGTETRREFLKSSAGLFALAVGVPGRLRGALSDPLPPQRITLAQLEATHDVKNNLDRAREAFVQAGKDGAGWIMFPECFLSGYYTGFDGVEVAMAFAEIQDLCRETGVIGLIGTGWKEKGKTYNQIRIIDTHGLLADQYAKTCLCYSESEFTAGGFPMLHALGGITFGTLICNDMWVTPGFSDGPDPHLSLQQARAGAQVIFLAANSGTELKYRPYHESNLFTRAAEAKCPIVVVNAFEKPEINATSGVVGTNFEYLSSLPRDRATVQTVEFIPANRNSQHAAP